MANQFYKQILRILAVAFLLSWQPARADNGWEWSITPYLWGSDIDFDAEVNERQLGGSVAFSDLVDKLDMALQLHIEGHSTNAWGVFGDVTYISISDDSALPSGAQLDTKADVTIFELGGIYTAMDGVDLLFGIRNMGLDTEIGVRPPGITVSGDPGFTDGLLGVRFTGELSDRWDYLLRLDGSAGDSEGTLNAVAGFGYSFGNKGNKRFLFGYRHMQIETKREGNSDLQVELTMSGPIAGFEFRF
jgi:hypothetical protein